LSNLIFLRESRADGGHEPAKPHPGNLFGTAESRPPTIGALLLPLLKNRGFVVVCLLSFGSTIVRETFNIWTPVYLHEHAGYSVSSAGSLSAVFPAVGVVSVLLCGWLSDRIGENGRSTIMLVGFVVAAVALLMLTRLQITPAGSWLAVMTIGCIAFGLLGPYSYLGGAYALDFGGKQAGAVSSGIIDGVGYLGGVLAGDAVARVAVTFGWRGVFIALAAVCGLAALGAGYLYLWNSRPRAVIASLT
jgi:OPA family glycerol-3-phosphate transporter-like MFS transporter